MLEQLNKCYICPNKCGVNRLNKEYGICRADNNIKVALISLHKFEEPCISGKQGSGTVFFSNCNLKCVYCQNYKISQEGKGEYITIEELADKFIYLQSIGAHNINLVTPTIYTYHIIEAIKIAKKNGLKIPIIYNTNGYENIETIKKLKGYIDVYLPDLKYYYDEIAYKYSGIKNYFEISTNAIKEMYNQVGYPQFDKDGMITKGLIIRHLILPNNLDNSKKVLKWIDKNIDKRVYVSIMTQYFPCYKAREHIEINRKLNIKEYNIMENYIFKLNIDNGYMQDLEDNEEKYVPNF